MSKIIKLFLALFIAAGLIFAIIKFSQPETNSSNPSQSALNDTDTQQEEIKSAEVFPMFTETLRQREYPGGDFVIEQTLTNGTNYRQFIASYQSEGLKIYGLLTVPLAPKPEGGYPAVVFVHGYIPPKQYSTTGSYPGYQATLARSGMITFKPDLRGHGNSEGEASSAHHSEKYVVDALYAIAYLKNYANVNPERIGYWGHSNGGEIGLRAVVISADIKAASFWAGVVGNYEDMLETYNDKISFLRNNNNPLIEKYGLPSQNPEFWNKLDPYSYLKDISAPIQLQHGTADSSVPIELSLQLKKALEKSNKEAEYYEYPGDDHNIGSNSSLAWKRTIEFFKENL